MSIAVGGLISGLDTNSMIEQLLELERQPIVKLQRKEAAYQVELSAYGSLKGVLGSLKSAVEALNSMSNFNCFSAVSGNTDLFSVSADENATVGSYGITVQHLAEAHKLSSGAFSKGEYMGEGTLHLKVGNASTTDIDISATDTIVEVAQAINDAEAGVRAGVIFDGTDYFLTLAAEQTGTKNVINLTVTDTGDTNDTDMNGISRLVYDLGVTENLSNVQDPADSIITVDGVVNIHRDTNVINDVIQGVTLTLESAPAAPDNQATLTVPSYLVASSLTMVLSQRLARKLCPKCKVRDKNFNPAELEDMGFSKDEISTLELYGPGGCSECMGAGYKGRVGLFELMEVTDKLSRIISAQVSEDQLRKTALLEGMVTLRDAGLEKIRKGVTSVEEILKRTTVTKGAIPAYLADPEVEHYESKAVIFREGNKGSDFFKLVKGELIVVRAGKKIAEIVQPGEYFGEISAITGKKRSETVLSRGNSIVQRFPGNKMPEIIEKYPEITKNLLQASADRLNYANNIIVNIMNKRVQ